MTLPGLPPFREGKLTLRSISDSSVGAMLFYAQGKNNYPKMPPKKLQNLKKEKITNSLGNHTRSGKMAYGVRLWWMPPRCGLQSPIDTTEGPVRTRYEEVSGPQVPI